MLDCSDHISVFNGQENQFSMVFHSMFYILTECPINSKAHAAVRVDTVIFVVGVKYTLLHLSFFISVTFINDVI